MPNRPRFLRGRLHSRVAGRRCLAVAPQRYIGATGDALLAEGHQTFGEALALTKSADVTNPTNHDGCRRPQSLSGFVRRNVRSRPGNINTSNYDRQHDVRTGDGSRASGWQPGARWPLP
jgi:hypothetical protein